MDSPAQARRERRASSGCRGGPPHALVAFHTGYELDADDWADVRALCERFDIPIPDDYRRFR